MPMTRNRKPRWCHTSLHWNIYRSGSRKKEDTSGQNVKNQDQRMLNISSVPFKRSAQPNRLPYFGLIPNPRDGPSNVLSIEYHMNFADGNCRWGLWNKAGVMIGFVAVEGTGALHHGTHESLMKIHPQMRGCSRLSSESRWWYNRSCNYVGWAPMGTIATNTKFQQVPVGQQTARKSWSPRWTASWISGALLW